MTRVSIHTGFMVDMFSPCLVTEGTACGPSSVCINLVCASLVFLGVKPCLACLVAAVFARERVSVQISTHAGVGQAGQGLTAPPLTQAQVTAAGLRGQFGWAALTTVAPVVSAAGGVTAPICRLVGAAPHAQATTARRVSAI